MWSVQWYFNEGGELIKCNGVSGKVFRVDWAGVNPGIIKIYTEIE